MLALKSGRCELVVVVAEAMFGVLLGFTRSGMEVYVERLICCCKRLQGGVRLGLVEKWQICRYM